MPDGSLGLAAPEHAIEAAILAKVVKRSAWIATPRRAFREMNIASPQRRYVSGATHRYLERQYRLKVAAGPPSGVSLKDDYLHVSSPKGTPEEVRAALDDWFLARAHEQFHHRLQSWLPWSKRHQLPAPKLQIRKMLKCWGSAGTGGRIALNTELIHAPGSCIE